MNRCEKCNRKLKSKGLIYKKYQIFKTCQCGYNPNLNYLSSLQEKSIKANKDFISKFSDEKLEKLMKPFDNYEINYHIGG